MLHLYLEYHIIFATKKIMEQLHAHEVLHMMEGNSYTELSLREAIIQKFGEQQRFFTCSANNMDVDTLIEFLKRKGKFIPANGGFTVDMTKVCNHWWGILIPSSVKLNIIYVNS